MRPLSAVQMWTVTVAGLAAVLSLGMVIVGPGVFTIDEQAYRFQTELVGDGVWGLPYPTATVLDQDLGAPLSNSELGSRNWYPAARHPAYIHLLGAGTAVHDVYGPLLVSILGVLLTAVGVEHVARWLGRVPRWSAFWFAGLGSPAAFHGLVSWAHAPALGLLSVGLALLLRATPQRRTITVLAVAALTGAVLLRSDGPLAVAAIGCGLLIGARGNRMHVYRFAVAGAGGLIGLVAGTNWHGSVVESNTVAGTGTGREIDIARYVLNALEIFLIPGSELAVLRLVAVALLVTAVLWHRRVGSAGKTTTTALAVMATALGIVGSLSDGTYGSLLPAAPLAAIGVMGLLIGAGRDTPATGEAETDDWRARARVLATMAAVAMVAPVLATASGGGGLGWGGRYVLLSLAPLIPLAMAGASALWRAPETRTVVVGAMVVTVAVQLSGFLTLVDYHRRSLAAPPVLTAGLEGLEGEFELIATFDPRVGRMAPHQARTSPLVSVGSAEDLETLLQLAAVSDVDEVAVVSLFTPESPGLPAGWTEKEFRDQPLKVLVVGSADPVPEER